ncbi:cysteine desulfurase [Irregularibacter muris]|uniref:Cysteine desulfurase n=1 Tax=Irregularibacter muris TaxID=1796619 RepID=A0AAE3HCG4_9FIRM|nr:cysteine desulfurase family protein [Irregularibacter muris]MCR1897792.1 cysteine desulfurase [Irregularibacter muris]
MQEIYLDNSATTRPLDDVIEIMVEYYKNEYGNPSSLHKKGIEAERGIKYARKEIADFLKVGENEIVFTSGGTEGNNIAIRGTVIRNKRRGKHIITSTIEHPSVLNVFKALEKEGFEVSYLPVNHQGQINLEELKGTLRKDTIFVSMMMVNNEIGTIQPIKKIGRIIKEHNPQCIFHVDGVQAFSKVPCYPKEWAIDLLTISSHKIHGPKGVGALFINKNILLSPLTIGGGQESGLRSGTENVPGIVGLGKAVESLKDQFNEKRSYLYDLREKTKYRIIHEIPQAVINGPDSPEEVAPHILSVSFKDIKGEVLLHSLEQLGIYVSTGSACSSKDKGQSHVLKNIGLSKDLLMGTIRISFSSYNTIEEMETFIKILKENIVTLRRIIGR